jgi:aspartate aminotransferase
VPWLRLSRRRSQGPGSIRLSDFEGIHVAPQFIVCASGASGALYLTLRSILSLNDEVIVVGPVEAAYSARVAICYGRAVPFHTRFEDGWQIDAARFAAAVTPETRAVILQSPQNPTGVCHSQAAVDAIGRLLAERSAQYGRPIWLISDAAFRRIVAPGVVPHRTFQAHAYSVVCYSLSHDLAIPGERIGCVAVNPELPGVDLLVRSLGHVNELSGFMHAHRVHQRLIPRVVNARAAVDIELYNQARRIVCEALKECGIEFVNPEGGFFVFPRIPVGVDEDAFCEALTKRLVVVVPGEAFNCRGFYRLAFCESPEIVARKIELFEVAYTETIKELTGG